MPKKNKKRQREIDWSAEANFQKNRSIIYIEHSMECPIFSLKAEEFLKFLQDQIPERQFALIRNGYGKMQPRAGAFEIEFAQNARTSRHCLWSGLDKGPPRRDKFPQFENLMPAIQRVLKKFYPDPRSRNSADDGEMDEAAT
ncbi:selenoprotein BthD [Musca vetustissima]|uniref:selenoprotein BthD n=1 Tax=Musca vetustissima TaxID=27455 RepID=UPI002AB7D46D|nr:selenoprotein BthD [Musca vetustissima]